MPGIFSPEEQAFLDSLQKPYFILTVPIGTAQTDVEYHVLGRQFIVLTCPVDVTCRVNSVEADAFSLLKVAGYKGPFVRLYFSNASTSATSVQLLVGVSVDLAVAAPKTQVQVLDSLGTVEDPLYTGAYDQVGAGWQRLQQVWDGLQGMLQAEIGSATDAYRPVRRGQLFFVDQFETANIKWATSGTVAQTTAAGEVLHGAGAMKLTTGAVSGNIAEADVWVDTPPLKKLYLSLYWKQLTLATNPEAQFNLYFYDVASSKYYIIGLQYLSASTKWQYYGSDALWHDVTGSYDMRLISAPWNLLFMELDVANGKYGKCCLGGKWFDLSALTAYSSAVTVGWGQTEIDVLLTTRTAAASNMSADDVVLSGVLNLT